MKVNNYKDFACFDYTSTAEKTRFELGDIVTRVSTDGTEIGIVIQIHDSHELRTDMFGNCSTDEISMSTNEEILKFRKSLIQEIN